MQVEELKWPANIGIITCKNYLENGFKWSTEFREPSENIFDPNIHRYLAEAKVVPESNTLKIVFPFQILFSSTAPSTLTIELYRLLTPAMNIWSLDSKRDYEYTNNTEENTKISTAQFRWLEFPISNSHIISEMRRFTFRLHFINHKGGITGSLHELKDILFFTLIVKSPKHKILQNDLIEVRRLIERAAQDLHDRLEPEKTDRV